MSIAQALWLALLQGFSELFPISSLGHSVLVPSLLGWSIDQRSQTFLPFLVTLHLGTATALVIFFWRDWWALLRAFVRTVVRGRITDDSNEHLVWMVIFGTIPTGILGFFLESRLRQLFGNPAVAAGFLLVNGLIMLGGEYLRRRRDSLKDRGVFFRHESGKDVGALTWRSAMAIGLAQSAALIPGISRSGSAMVAGLLVQLKHEPAARFAFLLATPIIAAAGLLEVPVLLAPEGRSMLGLAILGGCAAGLTAYVSVKFLMRYFAFGRLDPFAYYCWALGAAGLIVLAIR